MRLLTHRSALCSCLAESHFQVFGVEPNPKVRHLVQPLLRHRGDVDKLAQSLALDTAIRASLRTVKFTHQFKGK